MRLVENKTHLFFLGGNNREMLLMYMSSGTQAQQAFLKTKCQKNWYTRSVSLKTDTPWNQVEITPHEPTTDDWAKPHPC